MLKKVIGVSIIALYLSGCSFFWTDIKLAKGFSEGQIKLGMSKDEAYKFISPAVGCTKIKRTAEANYEMWDFATRFCGTNLVNSYALVFTNNKLIEIRTVQSIGDLDW